MWPTRPKWTAHYSSESGVGQVSEAYAFAQGSWPAVGSSLHLPTLLWTYSLVPTLALLWSDPLDLEAGSPIWNSLGTSTVHCLWPT